MGLALGGPGRVDADLLERLVDDCARSSLVPRFQMFSGSITMSRTLRRGFSDEIGSWKIICMRVRASRMSWPSIVVSSWPSKRTEPEVGRGSCMTARPVVRLPAAGLADEAERLALADVEADPGDGVDDEPGAPDGELDHEVLDAQHEVVAVAQVGLARAGHYETSARPTVTRSSLPSVLAPLVVLGRAHRVPARVEVVGGLGRHERRRLRRGSCPGRTRSGARTGTLAAG